MEEQLLASLLESARQRFIEKNSQMIKSSRHLQDRWLSMTDNHPVKDAVAYASSTHRFDEPETLKKVEASLKFRVLAGIITRPVAYPEEPRGGFCARQEPDLETGGFKCFVPGNQDAADKWHAFAGHNCLCPFYESPAPVVEEKETEMDKLLDDGEDLYEVWRELGLLRKDESPARDA